MAKTTKRSSRRTILRWLGAAPIGAALVGCGPMMSGADGGRGDAGGGLGDGGPGDGGAPDAGSCDPTESDALGPFFEGGSPMRMRIAGAEEPGVPLLVEGRLAALASCATGLAGYTVDIWQADEAGNYYAAGATDYRLRGRVVTGADGRFAFETIRPGNYETGSGPRPAHLHLNVYASDGSSRLTTQIYFRGDAFLGAADGCQPPTCFSGDEDRQLDLRPADVSGRSGFAAGLRLVVPA